MRPRCCSGNPTHSTPVTPLPPTNEAQSPGLPGRWEGAQGETHSPARHQKPPAIRPIRATSVRGVIGPDQHGPAPRGPAPADRAYLVGWLGGF